MVKHLSLSIVSGSEDILHWIKFCFVKYLKTESITRVYKKKNANCFEYKIQGTYAEKILNKLQKNYRDGMIRKWGVL